MNAIHGAGQDIRSALRRRRRALALTQELRLPSWAGFARLSSAASGTWCRTASITTGSPQRRPRKSLLTRSPMIRHALVK
jgi:hypothetical protein